MYFKSAKKDDIANVIFQQAYESICKYNNQNSEEVIAFETIKKTLLNN